MSVNHLMKTKDEDVSERIKKEINKVCSDDVDLQDFLIFAISDELNNPSDWMSKREKERYGDIIKEIITNSKGEL